MKNVNFQSSVLTNEEKSKQNLNSNSEVENLINHKQLISFDHLNTSFISLVPGLFEFFILVP